MNQSKENSSNSQFLAQTSLKLLDALTGESSLQQLVDLGYEMFGNPVLLIDTSLKTIAFSNSKIHDDPIWNEYVISGYASLSSVNYYTRNKLSQLVIQSDSPFFWTDPYSKYPRIMSKIVIESRQVALLSIIAHEKPFQNTDLDLAALLSKALAIELQKNKFIHFSRGRMYETFIEELLSGKTKDREIINERLKVLDIHFRKNLYTLTLDISRFDNSVSSLAYLRNELEKKISNSKAVVYDDKIVVVISYDNDYQTYKSEIMELKKFLKTYHLYTGMSRRFYHLEKVQEYYLQSLNALRLGMLLNKEENFYPYEEYAIYHFVESSGGGNLKKNCNPALLKLIDFDEENNTDYTRSLYAFIVHSKNITESAKALNIHRNTMFYRLEKIESIMDIDIHNSNTFLHLHLSFKILELLKINLP